jgi:hypothetical protein
MPSAETTRTHAFPALLSPPAKSRFPETETGVRRDSVRVWNYWGLRDDLIDNFVAMIDPAMSGLPSQDARWQLKSHVHRTPVSMAL